MNDVRILMVPGWTNSGPEHWQTHWQRLHPEYRRVHQRDWDHPDPADWIAALDSAVNETDGRVVAVAHSLGCIAVVKWAQTASAQSRAKMIGAFLVAPSDVERPDAPEPLGAWAPVPMTTPPFPTVLVASRTDEYLSVDRARALSAAWGSDLVDAGDAGHLNTAAGYGPWPEGHHWLAEFIDQITARADRSLNR